METELRRAVNALCDDAVRTGGSVPNGGVRGPESIRCCCYRRPCRPCCRQWHVLPVTPLILPQDAMVPASLQPAPPPACPARRKGWRSSSVCTFVTTTKQNLSHTAGSLFILANMPSDHVTTVLP